jgi:hypothetical protein
MQTFKSFPDLGLVFRRMLLHDKLKAIPPIRLYASILNWAIDNKPLDVVIKYVMDLYNDDPDEVIFVFDQDIINLIKTIHYEPQTH